MLKKEERIAIAQDTLQIIQNGFFVAPDGKTVQMDAAQQAAQAQTQIWTSADLELLLQKMSPNDNFTTTFEVTNETTLTAVRRLLAASETKVLCLNFASAKNPGGGFLTGAQAQEESIARATGLYPCLLKAQVPYYDLHRQTKTCLYTDTMIFSPEVPIFKNERGENLSKLATVSVITSAAVNAGVVRRQEVQHIPKIESMMRTRISKMLALAAVNERKVLVLGAWGCGVFQNDPVQIAQWFYDALQLPLFKQQFQHIVFAIYSRETRFLTAFQRWFE